LTPSGKSKAVTKAELALLVYAVILNSQIRLRKDDFGELRTTRVVAGPRFSSLRVRQDYPVDPVTIGGAGLAGVLGAPVYSVNPKMGAMSSSSFSPLWSSGAWARLLQAICLGSWRERNARAEEPERGRRAEAGIIVAIQNYLNSLGAWVTIVQGTIFVNCRTSF
jgi:hypothetical protein